MTPTAPATTGKTVLELARAGRFDQVRDLFAPNLRPMVTAETLQAASNVELARLGPVSSVGPPVAEPAHTGVIVVRVPVTCGARAPDVGGRGARIRLAHRSAARAGQRGGARRAVGAPLRAPYHFDEHDVPVGYGPLAVRHDQRASPARATPAVVLLGGSGPVDRDETIGRETSRSRTSRGAWPAAAWRCCASTRSPSPTGTRCPGARLHAGRRVRPSRRGDPSAAPAPGRRRRAGCGRRAQPGRHGRPARRGGRAVGRRAGHPGRRDAAAALGRGPAVPLPRLAGPGRPPRPSPPSRR